MKKKCKITFFTKKEKFAHETRKNYYYHRMTLHPPVFQKKGISLLAQSLRKLSFEDQVILGTNAGTLLACFLPWASMAPLYGPTTFMNAFSGAAWLIGGIIFLLALFSVILFWDDLFGKYIIRFHIPRITLLGAASIQSLLLLLCAWSVLRTVGTDYATVDFRFGFVACLLLQGIALVAVWLRARSSKQEAAKEFFQLPTSGKSGESTSNYHTK